MGAFTKEFYKLRIPSISWKPKAQGNQKHKDMQLLCVDPLLSWFPVRYCSKENSLKQDFDAKEVNKTDGNEAKSALSIKPLKIQNRLDSYVL